MEDFVVKIYGHIDFEIWNTFLKISNQGTFLFHRDFLSYHQDRFQDFSLMIHFKGELIALFPANLKDNQLYSHQGLTYGGLIHQPHLSVKLLLGCYASILKFLKRHQIETLTLKELPNVYLKEPTNQILPYICFKTEAQLIRTDVHSVINTKQKTFSKSRVNGIKRGRKHQLKVKETSCFNDFWNAILIPNLNDKHAVKPVHSLEEISELKSKFPDNIRQFNVFCNEKIVAGTTIFEMEHIAHSQYISGNSDKNTLGSLDYLHHYLLKNVFNDKTYFSFGISNENNGQQINEGLLYWKEGFGALPVPQSFYKIKTVNYTKLEDVFI